MDAKFPPNPGGRLAAAVIVLCLLAVACSSGAPDPAQETLEGAQAEVSAGATIDNDKSEPGGKGEGKNESSGGKNDDGDKEPGDNSSDSADEAAETGDEDGADESGSSMAVPAAGKYSYVQTGWEELCQAGNCSRSDLPPSQSVTISFHEKKPSHAVFSSETEGSGSQTQALTYDSRPGSVSVVLLKSRFSSNGFSFTTEVIPDPPVLAARLPFEVGDGWSGEWTDRNNEVDGSYRFDVVARETVTVDGREEEAIVLNSVMELTGEYQGKTKLRLWVLPDTFTIVASKGFTDIDSQYGTYRTRFATSYNSGPN